MVRCFTDDVVVGALIGVLVSYFIFFFDKQREGDQGRVLAMEFEMWFSHSPPPPTPHTTGKGGGGGGGENRSAWLGMGAHTHTRTHKRNTNKKGRIHHAKVRKTCQINAAVYLHILYSQLAKWQEK